MWLVQHPVQLASFDPWYAQSHSRCTHLTGHHERECQTDPANKHVALTLEEERRKEQPGKTKGINKYKPGYNMLHQFIVAFVKITCSSNFRNSNPDTCL